MILSKKINCFSCASGELKDFGFVIPIVAGYERQIYGCNTCGATKITWVGTKFTRETGAGYVSYKK